MAREWCTLDDIPRLTRQRVLDANDLLDAMDEAEEESQKNANGKRPRK